ncbi:MAG: LETM1-related biofilm-associated protein [Flavobacteriaceae bacterium]
MNPSSAGWIHKFINEFPKETLIDSYTGPLSFYETLKKSGFIYGVSIKTLLEVPVSDFKLTQEENTKVTLFHALLYMYYSEKPTATMPEAIEDMVLFYKTIEKGKPGFFQKLRFTKSASENLEHILAARIYESNSLIKTEAASLFTYALLFGDVLAFRFYLQHPKGLKNYLEALEETLIQFSIWALQSKQKKNKYDALIIEMVSESAQYATHSSDIFSHVVVDQLKERTILEKQFVLDICCLAVWDDKKIDTTETLFLKEIAFHLGISNQYLESCMEAIKAFSLTNEHKIKLFQYTHPVKQLYKQSTTTVKLLVLRNKKRLLKELNESGELLVLLGQSTSRDLTAEEKAKVKDQLLDIFKTIPSLTIFMLPGGALLLPLVVKLIPKLLPSAFNENRVEED